MIFGIPIGEAHFDISLTNTPKLTKSRMQCHCYRSRITRNLQRYVDNVCNHMIRLVFRIRWIKKTVLWSPYVYDMVTVIIIYTCVCVHNIFITWFKNFYANCHSTLNWWLCNICTLSPEKPFNFRHWIGILNSPLFHIYIWYRHK